MVIGGANGIGRAIAESFAAESASVAILDLSLAVENTAREIGTSASVQTLGIVTDACNYQAMQTAAKQIEDRFGRADHIVYAAGAGSGKFGFPFWNLDPQDWERVIRINLMGAVHAAHAFGPMLVNQGEGSVLFLGSVAGQIGSQTDPPYSAAKAGVINFAMCAAKDLAPFGVRVNTICPGMIRTDLNRSVWQAWNDSQTDSNKLDYEAWGSSKVKQVAPLGRWQLPEEIAALAVFLASPHGRNITGQTLNVDGGQVMHW